MFIERDSVRRKAAEHKSAIGSHPGNAGKAEVFLAQRPAVAVGIRDGAELAVVAVGPAVVGASENFRVALRYLTHGGGPMAASIEQQAHLAAVIAHHDHGRASDFPQPVVARLGNLAGVPHVDPSAMKD